MWIGGVRVAITDGRGRVLLVRHHYEDEGKSIWMLPGGSIEDGETSRDAAMREALEETGLIIRVGKLLWHIEEAGERGQRFVNFFEASVIGGKPELGSDPELGESQVLTDIGFFTREEIESLDNIYPDFLRNELWEKIEADSVFETYKIRK